MRSSPLALTRLLVAAVVLSSPATALPAASMYDLPIYSEAMTKALSTESLRAAASATDDPNVLLGLAYLARPGDPARRALSARLVGIDPKLAPAASVITVMMDGADDASVAALIERDPDNALGYYLRAHLLYRAGNDAEATSAFRKASTCKELRLYESVTADALLKALDALKLAGRDRLNVLSWMAARTFNSAAEQIQPLHNDLEELTRKGDAAKREETSDLLLILAGHLYRTNFNNRSYGERALQVAFRLKAEAAAAEDSPRAYGYAAVTQALVSTMISWPQIADGDQISRVVPFVPSRIYHAFFLTDPGASTRPAEKLDLPPDARATFEQAKRDEVKAAEALIVAALADPDQIVGAYLRGVIVREGETAKRPWVSQHTYVERAMSRFPAVFKATVHMEGAMDAVNAARSDDPRQKNISRMMLVAGELVGYAFKHDNQLPASLDVLLKEKLLDDPAEINSLITGRPYVYVGANRKLPEKRDERFGLILLYDDHQANGRHQAALAIPGGIELSAEDLKQRLERQGK